jgi:hypothetical protein
VILERQRQQGWGAKVIEQLATDLSVAFPDMKGFSSRNLKYMKFFAQECPNRQIGQQTAAQLPWFHIITLLSAVDAQVKAEDDKPTIGLLLCRSQNRLVAEYALSGINKPIGVAEYQLVRALPVPLDTSLPSIEQLEEALSRELEQP